MVVGGVNSTAGASKSTAIGTNLWISSSADNAVAVSAYTSKSCATTEPGSLTLCADEKVTIEGSALVVNGVDVLNTTSNLKAELVNTKADFQVQLANKKAELATTKAELATTKPSSTKRWPVRKKRWTISNPGSTRWRRRPRARQAPRLVRWWARFLPSASPPPLSREPSPRNAQRRVTAASQRPCSPGHGITLPFSTISLATNLLCKERTVSNRSVRISWSSHHFDLRRAKSCMSP